MLNAEEIKICERFKEVRNSLQMRQGAFANEIKTTQGHVSDIENKRKGVSNRVIEIICLKFNVNENWLRTGEGEMFNTFSEDEQYAANVGKLQRTDDETIMRWVNAIAETDSESLKAVETFLKKILDIQN